MATKNNTTNNATNNNSNNTKGAINMANNNTNNNNATTNNGNTKQVATTLQTSANVLSGIKGITFTHNSRNITISNATTGKKCFEIWQRKNAIRLYIPNYLLPVAKGVKNSGIYNIATGYNGYPQGTYSIYVPSASIPQVLTALVNASLTQAPTTATKTKKAPTTASN